MAIFNSLGSNYSPLFIRSAIKLLISSPPPTALSLLTQKLHQHHSGHIQLFSSGRDAITYSLQALGIKPGDTVLTSALTCWAVETGIIHSGAQISFVDISPTSLNPDLQSLNQALKSYPHPKALLIQHTLGFPAAISPIRSWCTKHRIKLIEDLAHSYSAQDSSLQPLGSTADAVILSFGRDKIIDALAGGAAIIPHPHTIPPLPLQTPASVTSTLLYPLLTLLIRSTYSFKLGKLIHFLTRSTPILSSPVTTSTPFLSPLSPKLAALVLIALAELSTNIKHRRHITHLYQQTISLPPPFSPSLISRSTCLRYPLLVPHRPSLLAHLSRSSLYFTDIWYRQPVDTGSNLSLHSSYLPGSCPHAESTASRIINLPTHRHITPQIAHYLSQLVNQHLTLHG